MSQHFLEVIGRVVTDAAFRKELAISPRETCEKFGLPLEDSEYRTLASIDATELEEAAAEYVRTDGAVG